jgi:hypothetical protein
MNKNRPEGEDADMEYRKTNPDAKHIAAPDQRPTHGDGITAPALHRRLFWDMRFEDIDWQGSHVTIIGRLMERGDDDEIAELIRFYGYDFVLHTLKTELTYLPDYAIPRVCDYFKLKREELRCSTRLPWRQGYWI